MDKSSVLRVRFGIRVKDLLILKGLTTNDLAATITVSLETLEEILNGSYTHVTIKELEMVACALQTPLYHLLEPDPLISATTPR